MIYLFLNIYKLYLLILKYNFNLSPFVLVHIKIKLIDGTNNSKKNKKL